MTITLNLETEAGPDAKMFVANAATAIRYKQLFGADLGIALGQLLEQADMSVLQSVQGDGISTEELSPEMMQVLIWLTTSGLSDVIKQLAYIENMQAEKADIPRLTEDDYIEWLEQFPALELLRNAASIVGLYMGQKAGTAVPKKEVARRNEG